MDGSNRAIDDVTGDSCDPHSFPGRLPLMAVAVKEEDLHKQDATRHLAMSRVLSPPLKSFASERVTMPFGSLFPSAVDSCNHKYLRLDQTLPSKCDRQHYSYLRPLKTR